MFSFKQRRNALALMMAAGLAIGGAAIAAEPAAPPAPPKPYVIQGTVSKPVREAVESRDRTPAMTARDADRKPAELLALSGVKPGDRVVEFASFGQYFTTMLSSIVGEKGLIYMYDLPYTEARAGAASRDFVAKHANSRYELVDYNTIQLPQNVDIVFNVLYYHDLSINKTDVAVLNKKVLDALKPGGVYFIVDHNARPGSGREDTDKLHRIDPAMIRQEVTAAGFELVEESKLLANPEDDHTWMVFAAGKRGTTDQSVFKFRKPLKKK
jgi:predicted methyltransferase